MRTKPVTKCSMLACTLLSLCAGLTTPASAQFGEWVARYQLGQSDYDTSMKIDASGNIYVSAAVSGAGNQGIDFVTIKYDSAGNQQWAAVYNGAPANGSDIPTDLAVDASGNVYVTGTSSDTKTYEQYATVKYDSAGNEQWVATYDGPYASDYDRPAALAVDASGKRVCNRRVGRLDVLAGLRHD